MTARKVAAKKKATFRRYDVAEHLKTEADILGYMQAVMAESGNEPAVIAIALGDVARARNMSELARQTGLTREGLRKALSADGNPSFATVHKVARALGLRLTVAAA